MKIKLMTIFGTRPEIIRLSVIINRLDRFCDQMLVHTGQNHEENLSEIFFRQLNIRQPDEHLGISEVALAEQLGQIISRIGAVLDRAAPDRILILGDTNSGLSSIVAARWGIPIFHLEAGNRCYDDRVPEEINRRIIDHCSTILMPYTHRSKENLLREGIERERIFVVGNPIYEVLSAYGPQIEASDILNRLSVKPREYFVVTMHRSENVDDSRRLEQLFTGIEWIAERYRQPVIVSLHPRTRDKMARFGVKVVSPGIHILKPLGFIDFVALEQTARCVITDSGTVQEECCILGVPNVTIRDVTERAETMECGSNILSGEKPEGVLSAVEVALDSAGGWQSPPEYMEKNVSATVCKIVLGNSSVRKYGSRGAERP